MINWFARNPVAANLLMLFIVASGLLSLMTQMPVEIFPAFETRMITVSTSLRGASPQEMEQSVSVRVEEAVDDLAGISDISSVSEEGVSVVTLEVDQRADPESVLAEVKNRVDAISTFPAQMDRPVITLPQWRRPAITVAVTSPHSEDELWSMAEKVRNELRALPGITQVELAGRRQHEVAIEVSSLTLQQYHLTLEDIGEAIKGSSLDLSAGAIRTEGGDVLVRSQGQAYRKQDFEAIVVRVSPEGALIRLGDLAQVRESLGENQVKTRFNGVPAVMLQVFETGAVSPVTISERVRAHLLESQTMMPEGVTLDVWGDRSRILEKRLQTLSSNAIQGGILVLLLLTLFLRPAIAFWVFIGIPVSFMGAFLVMPLFDVSINMISLFGFIVVLGIVVDDAIVTGENIYRHLQHHEAPLDAVIKGAEEVSIPVTFGVLTTMVAFLPMAFIEGSRGQMFSQIVIVVLPIFFFSLLESKLILPTHLRHIRLGRGESRGISRWQENFAEGFERWVLRVYQPALARILEYRYTFLAVCVGVLVILFALLSSGWMRFVFFPRVQSEIAQATLYMPTGTPFSMTDAQVLRIAEAAEAMRDRYREVTTGESLILSVQATTGYGDGASGDHISSVVIEVLSPEERSSTVTSADLVKEWRKRIGSIPGAEGLNFRAEIGRGADPIEIHLLGDDYDSLSEVAGLLKEKLSRFPEVFDIEDSYADGKQSFEVQLKQEAYLLGLTRATILSQLQSAYLGLQVQRVQRGRDEVSVVVRYPREERSALPLLQDFLVEAPGGQRIPLGQVVDLQAGKTPTSLYRNNGKRTLTVTADVDKQKVNMLLLNREIQQFMDATLLRYPDVSMSLEGESLEQSQSLNSLEWGLWFVLFAIYVLLAIPLKSYVQPLIVMLVIPFSIIGAIAGHGIMGMDLTLISLLGMLALVGVVVNDSLVLVDFINRQLAQGVSVRQAILTAGAARFRPIMLTTLTTVIGLLPLLLERSTQAQFLIPMAVSLGFGILFATALTLFLVPVNYLIIEDLKRIKTSYTE
ncbi:MAG: efflux RND transporter permease subunit [Hahellaceae bacterium]|nr:efflux RND transporter permease subunit [Hahellaceae bacterium]